VRRQTKTLNNKCLKCNCLLQYYGELVVARFLGYLFFSPYVDFSAGKNAIEIQRCKRNKRRNNKTYALHGPDGRKSEAPTRRADDGSDETLPVRECGQRSAVEHVDETGNHESETA